MNCFILLRVMADYMSEGGIEPTRAWSYRAFTGVVVHFYFQGLVAMVSSS